MISRSPCSTKSCFTVDNRHYINNVFFFLGGGGGGEKGGAKHPGISHFSVFKN